MKHGLKEEGERKSCERKRGIHNVDGKRDSIMGVCEW